MSDRGALAYLFASGAAAICILDDGTLKASAKIDPHAALIFWLPQACCIAVSRQARREAGEAPDVATMTAALRQAAADHGVTLAPHDIAVERAGEAAARVDAYANAMKGTGRLRAFNETYRAQRQAAAKGWGFMSYSTALGRLRAQIGARLAAGGNVYEPSDMLAEVFR